jgi:hypothetical protein
VRTGKIIRLLVERNSYRRLTELDKFLVDSIKEASTFDLTVRNGRNISYLKNAILIAEYQFGERVPNKCHRNLKSGDIYKNDLLLFSLQRMVTSIEMTCYFSVFETCMLNTISTRTPPSHSILLWVMLLSLEQSWK